MAQEKLTYPSIPVKQWWQLRNKFKQSIPSTVTLGYLAAALSMSEASAKANVLPAIVAFKIIDQDGKPTDRAKQWRDDEKYPEVCEQIRQEVYPDELVHALPPPNPNRESVERWIAQKTGVGHAAAQKQALMYVVLCEATPQNKTDAPVATGKRNQSKPPRSTSVKQAEAANTVLPAISAPAAPHERVVPSQSEPSLHIDIQIHIAADASGDQIDQIFASMAKHLYRRGD